MKAWWDNLSSRERLALYALGAVAGLFALLQLIIAPLGGWKSDAERRARTAETNYRLVVEAAALGQQRGPAKGANQTTPVRTAVREAAATHSVILNFINERADGVVETQAANAPPDQLFSMLATLEQQYGVRVVSADIARLSDNEGAVRAQMTFAR